LWWAGRVGSYEKAKVGVDRSQRCVSISFYPIRRICWGRAKRRVLNRNMIPLTSYLLLKIRYHFTLIKCESNANTAFTSCFGVSYVRREHPRKSEPPRREGKMRLISTVVNPIHGNDSLS